VAMAGKSTWSQSQSPWTQHALPASNGFPEGAMAKAFPS